LKQKKINILLLDNQTKFKEELKELRKFGFKINVTVTKSEKKYIDFISNYSPSIIISEYSLKKLSGLYALEYRNQIAPKIPFIFYSSLDDPDKIISCFRNGANDYIIKPDIDSLINSVTKNLADDEVIKTKETFAALLDNTNLGLYRTTPKGEIIFANSALIKMLGFSSFEDLKNCNFEETGYAEKGSRKSFLKEINKKNIVTNFETKWLKKNGEVIFVSENAQAIRDKRGKILYYEGIVEDITESINFQKALFESEQRFKLLNENSPVGIFQTDKDGKTIYVNPKWSELSKLSFIDALGYGWLKAVHPDDVAALKKKWTDDFRSNKISSAEYRFVHPDGKIIWVQGLAVPQKNEKGEITGYIGTIIDITESKLISEQIRSSELKFRTLFESANDAIFLMNGSIFIDCNDKTLEIFGCNKKEDIVNHPPYEFSPEFQPDGQKSFDKALKLIKLAKKTPQRFYWKHKKLNGELFDAEVSLNKIELDNQVLLQAIVRDITIEKTRENLLVESESRFRLFTELAPVGIIISDKAENVVYLSQRFTQIFGYAKEDIPNIDAWLKLSFPDEEKRNEIKKQINKLFNSYKKDDILSSLEFPVLCKYGKTKTIEIKVASSNKLNFITLNDITEKKQNELSLKTRLDRIQLLNDLNLRLQNILDLTEIIKTSYEIIPKFLNVDRTSIFLYSEEVDGLISEKYIGKIFDSQITDYQPLNIGISGKCFSEGEIIYIDDCSKTDIIPKRFVDELNLKSTVAIPLKALGKCIGVLRLDYTNSFHYFQKEELDFFKLLGLQLGVILSNAKSFTELKNTAKELKESNERYYLTIDASEQGIWDWNVITNEVFFSPQWKRQIGYEDHELKNEFNTWVEHLHPDEKEYCLNQVQNYLEKPEKHFILEFRFRHKDGNYRWIYNKASSILDKYGKVIRMFGSHTDVTNFKLAQIAIKEREEQFRTVFNKAADAIFIADMETGYILDANDTAATLMQLPKEKIIGMHQSQLHPKTNLEYSTNIFKTHIEEVINSGFSTPIENSIIRADGSLVPVEILASKIFYKGNDCLMGIFRDITDRVKAENELKASEENYRYLFENNPHPMWIYDLSNFKFLAVNNTAIQKYGYSKEEFLSITLYDISPEYERNKLKDNITDESDEIQKSGPWKHKLKNGKIILVNIISHKIDFQGIKARLVIADDVTEKIKAEQSLIESEKKLRTFFDTSIEGICAADKNDIITFVNPRFAKLLEYKPDELLSKNFKDLIPTEDLSNYLSQQKLREKGYSEIFELKLKSKSGKTLWFLVSASPLLDESGDFAGSFGMFTDITEMKFAEEKIKESEHRFRSIWENSFDAMRLTDENGIIIDVNEAFCNLVDKPKDEIIGKPFYQLYSDHEADYALATFKENFSNRKIKPIFEAKIHLWQNEEKWVSISNSFILDEKGNSLLLSIFRDITEHKLAEEKIRILYRGIEHSPASVVITDRNGFIEYVNPKFCEVTGYSLSELIGEKPSIISSGLTAPEVYQELWNNITNGRVWKGEFLNKKKNGDLFWESALISPILDDEGKICNYIGIKEDITDKKKLYEELIFAKEKAEESNRLKSSFLANMSHELRTPLIGILGYSEILMDDAKDDLIIEKASIIFKSGRRLLETLNFILDYSKLESEKIEIKIDFYDIINAINEIVNLHKPNAAKKNLELLFNSSIKKFYFKTDIKLLNSILNKLINNAVKFTMKGSVIVSTNFTSKDDEKFICIIVEDTGIGISKEKQDIIWEPFRQLSEGKARSFEGTGLGLTLVKKYVELLNGFIELVSEPGKGSKFSIYLPFLK